MSPRSAVTKTLVFETQPNNCACQNLTGKQDTQGRLIRSLTLGWQANQLLRESRELLEKIDS